MDIYISLSYTRYMDIRPQQKLCLFFSYKGGNALSTTENRVEFSSKLGFILSAAGSAVGLGNIWKFPGKAYACGGGAFLIIYLIIVAVVGTSVMMADFTIGR